MSKATSISHIKEPEGNDVMKVIPVFYPNDMITIVRDVKHPMVCTGISIAGTADNFNGKEDEYIFHLITKKTHYDEGYVLKKDNCYIITDKSCPNPYPSVVNCALEFRIKKSDLKNFLVVDDYYFTDEQKEPYHFPDGTIWMIQEKVLEAQKREEYAVVGLTGKKETSTVLDIGKNYLNNFNKNKLEQLPKNFFERKVYESAKDVINKHSKKMLTQIDKER